MLATVQCSVATAHPIMFSPYLTGLHGAAVAITGRRQPVLDSAVEALSSEGIDAVGLQVQSTL